MPWDSDDAEKHSKKANTSKKKRQWAHIADSVLEHGGDEGSAIRQANGVVGKSDAFEKLYQCAKDGLEKAIGDVARTFTTQEIRPFKRVYKPKKMKTSVRAFRRKKFLT